MSIMEGCSKLKIGWKEAHDTDDHWPRLDGKRSKVKVTRPHLVHSADGVRRPALATCAVTSKLKALRGGCLSHYLQGAGALWRQTTQLGNYVCVEVQVSVQTDKGSVVCNKLKFELQVHVGVYVSVLWSVYSGKTHWSWRTWAAELQTRRAVSCVAARPMSS